MMKIFKIYLFILLAVFGGCIHQRNLVYMQNQENTDITYSTKRKELYKIQPFDILTIAINSLDPTTSKIFDNPSSILNSGSGGTVSNIYASAYFNGYSVDELGFIQLPHIGKIKVKDLTINQISDTLSKKLEGYLKFYSLNIKLANFRVTFLGEVMHPGVTYVYNHDITIFQALGTVGDATVEADRKHVKLYRQEDDKVKSVILDLTDPSIINSEYYFLRPNDLVYVAPLKFKPQRLNFGTISLILSSLSVILVVATLLVRK